MVIYDRIAPYYNRVLSLPFFTYLRPAIFSLLREYDIRPPATVLEAACGPGHLSSFLSGRRYRVIGFDISIMQGIASPHRGSFPFAVGRMQAVPFRGRFDLVLNLYDSINHLSTLADLAATFVETRRLLKDGGMFIFDTNTRLAFKRIWGDRHPFIHEEEDFTMVMESSYSPATRRSRAVITVTEGDREIVGHFSERYFTLSEIRRELGNAGLTIAKRIPWCPNRAAYLGMAVKDLWVVRTR